MKKLLLLFSLWPLLISGQLVYDFERGLTGEWEQFPAGRWESSASGAISGTRSLHHSYDNLNTGTDVISLRTELFDPDSLISLEFIVKHGYLPSSLNKWLIILLSDSPAQNMTEDGKFNGFGIGVNLQNSNDSLYLYHFIDGVPVCPVSTGIDFEKEAGTLPYHFTIIRNTDGTWRFRGNLVGEELIKSKDFRFTESIGPGMRYFGIRYTYSSARDRLFWFDDLKIRAAIIPDTATPVISECKALANGMVKLFFSEEIERSGLVPEIIKLLPGGSHPDSLHLKGNELLLYFSELFIQAGEYRIVMDSIADRDGNTAQRLETDFTWYEAEIYDIIITEIMADPQPSVYLPEREYIELYNRSRFSIEIDSFVIGMGTRKWIIPDYSFSPGAYLLITSIDDGSIFTGIEKIGLFTGSSVISNEGQEITLYDIKGSVISTVKFNKGWYKDSFKAEGGWSLERIDRNNVCGDYDNWTASVDKSGGTPGRQNSADRPNPDRESPETYRIIFHSENEIEISFTENINPFTIGDPSIFVPLGSSLSPDQAEPVPPEYRSVKISYSDHFLPGKIYNLKIPESVQDCAGNPLLIKGPLRFGIPTASGPLDVIITEILADPVLGCPEFIEIYNTSGRLLELSDLRITVKEDGTGSVIPLYTDSMLFFPQEYLAVTKDRDALINFFDIRKPESVIESSEIPSFPDREGCIKLLNRSLQSIDECCYKGDDHFPLLTDQEGISLERVYIDRKAGIESIWHSASSVSGHGTPGYENSQSLDDFSGKMEASIEPEIFTPDNDGTDDLMIFSYTFEKEGYAGMVCIFDPSGRIINYLAGNVLFGTRGFLAWDGRDGSGRICRSGIYLLYMEAYHPSGKIKKFKGTVVLAKTGK